MHKMTEMQITATHSGRRTGRAREEGRWLGIDTKYFFFVFLSAYCVPGIIPSTSYGFLIPSLKQSCEIIITPGGIMT